MAIPEARAVALSSCEAEYIASAGAACQAVWLGRLLDDVVDIKLQPPQLKMDNMSAIALSKNPILHDRSTLIRNSIIFVNVWTPGRSSWISRVLRSNSLTS